MTLVNLACTYLAESTMKRKAKRIQLECTCNDKKVPLEQAPKQIQTIANMILDSDAIKIKMTCTLIRLHSVAMYLIINIMCVLLGA